MSSPSKIVELAPELRLWARTARFRARCAALTRLLAEHISPRDSYVSFSAGKDSSVIAHAAHAVHPGIAMLCVDSGVPYRWTAEERERWLAYAREHGWNLTLVPWDKWGDASVRHARDAAAHRRAVHARMFAPLERHAAARGLRTVVMGLRAEESPARAMSARTHGLVHRYSDGRSRVAPILW